MDVDHVSIFKIGPFRPLHHAKNISRVVHDHGMRDYESDYQTNGFAVFLHDYILHVVGSKYSMDGLGEFGTRKYATCFTDPSFVLFFRGGKEGPQTEDAIYITYPYFAIGLKQT